MPISTFNFVNCTFKFLRCETPAEGVYSVCIMGGVSFTLGACRIEMGGLGSPRTSERGECLTPEAPENPPQKKKKKKKAEAIGVTCIRET